MNMTLIAGVRGVRKSYIVADSRATIKYADGSQETVDNAKKWMHFNQHSTIAVAGDAALGAYIAKYMAGMSDELQAFNVTKNNFDCHLHDAAIAFNRLTSRFTQCAILLVGYDLTHNEDVDARRLGEVMAAGVMQHGQGITVTQDVDHEIIVAMSDALANSHHPLGSGDRVGINLKKSVVVGYKITVNSTGVHVDTEYADTFESIFYGMDSAYNTIELPLELISEIYFRDTTGMDYKGVLFRDTIALINFYKDIIQSRSYTGVGGGIFPVMMTENGGLFYSDEIIRQSRVDGIMHTDRDSKMIDGVMHFKNDTGQYEQYKDLLAIAEELESASYNMDFEIHY